MALLAAAVACGCGRIGYDEIAFAPSPDAGVDTPPVPCPSDMTEIAPGSPVCIELVERGTIPWTDATADCEALGRRLCADAEWFTGCVNASGLVDMIDGGYEWVAEVTDGVALKRGSTDCTVMSSHVVTDPYEYRCCLTRP